MAAVAVRRQAVLSGRFAPARVRSMRESQPARSPIEEPHGDNIRHARRSRSTRELSRGAIGCEYDSVRSTPRLVGQTNWLEDDCLHETICCATEVSGLKVNDCLQELRHRLFGW